MLFRSEQFEMIQYFFLFFFTVEAFIDVRMARTLPAPCTDFYVACNISYHNVATLGIVPREVVRKTVHDIETLQSLTANEYFGELIPGPSTIDMMEDVRTQVILFDCFVLC